MKIIDLNLENEKPYFCCLEDWSDELKEAGDHKEQWYQLMKNKGLKVKLAIDENGTTGGMIQYLPIQYSQAEGENLYFVLCIWVHGYKKGRGNFQKKGMGKALLEAAELDVRSMKSDGLVAWGISLPFFMRASWFKKQGYKVVDKDGMMRLLWKPFSDIATPPFWIKQKKKPVKIPGKVNVSVFKSGWCPAQNLVYERAKRAVKDHGDKIVFNEYNTLDREILKEWGIGDGLFIDKSAVRTGPPPSFEKIKRKINKSVKKL